MTSQEAIEYIRANYPDHNRYEGLCEALDTAIEALEKQIPKKPIGTEVDLQWGTVKCPTCKKAFCSEAWQREWCCECGQRILWESK